MSSSYQDYSSFSGYQYGSGSSQPATTQSSYTYGTGSGTYDYSQSGYGAYGSFTGQSYGSSTGGYTSGSYDYSSYYGSQPGATQSSSTSYSGSSSAQPATTSYSTSGYTSSSLYSSKDSSGYGGSSSQTDSTKAPDWSSYYTSGQSGTYGSTGTTTGYYSASSYSTPSYTYGTSGYTSQTGAYGSSTPGYGSQTSSYSSTPAASYSTYGKTDSSTYGKSSTFGTSSSSYGKDSSTASYGSSSLYGKSSSGSAFGSSSKGDTYGSYSSKTSSDKDRSSSYSTDSYPVREGYGSGFSYVNTASMTAKAAFGSTADKGAYSSGMTSSGKFGGSGPFSQSSGYAKSGSSWVFGNQDSSMYNGSKFGSMTALQASAKSSQYSDIMKSFTKAKPAEKEEDKIPDGPYTKYIDKDGNVKYKPGAPKPSSTTKSSSTGGSISSSGDRDRGRSRTDSGRDRDRSERRNDRTNDKKDDKTDGQEDMDQNGENEGGYRGGRGGRGGFDRGRGFRGGPMGRGFGRGGMRGRGGHFMDGPPPPHMMGFRGGWRGGYGPPRGFRGGRGGFPPHPDGPGSAPGQWKRKNNEFESGQPTKKPSEDAIDVMPYIKDHIQMYCSTNPDARKLAEESLKKMMMPNFCVLCNARMSAGQNSEMHYQGKNHAKKIKNFITTGMTKYAEKVKEEAAAESKGEGEEKGEENKGFDKKVSEARAMLTTRDSDFCKLCCVEFSSELQAKQHYDGKNHQKRVRQSMAPPDELGNFKCDVCNIRVNSQEILDLHLQGAKHKSKLKIVGGEKKKNTVVPEGGLVVDGGPRLQPAKENGNPTLAAMREKIFNQAPPPPKLKITEDLANYRTPSGKYYCPMCDVTLNTEIHFAQHAQSRMHRQKKLNKKYEDMKDK